MLDTMLGNNDGAPFKIDGIGDCTTEMEFEGNAVPQSWQAFDNLNNPSIISNGTFYFDNSKKPDKVQFARWGGVKGNIWDYSITPTASITGDSAVAVYFNPKTLAPNETRTVCTYYGLNNFAVQDLNPPLAVGVFAPKSLSLNDTKNGYIPNPITVTAHIENTGNGTATNSKVDIVLPQGMSTVGEESTGANLGNLAPGQKRQVTWNIQVANQSSAKNLSYNIVATADNAETKTLQLSLSVPAIIAQEKKAIIFVPGILGTEIHASSAVRSQDYLTNRVNGFNFENVDYAKDYKFWAPQSVTGGWGGLSDLANAKRIKTDALMLLCGTDGDPIAPTKAVDLNKDDELVGATNFYGPMMTDLINNFGNDYYVSFFAYDWRLTVKDAATKLESYINSNEYTDVILIAHSMGGLVSSSYISKSQNNKNKVKKLITLGTPYLGAPKAVYVFETGKMLGGSKDIVMAEPLKIMAPNLASAYELLPSYQYFDLNDTYYVSRYDEKDGWGIFNDTKTNLTTYHETIDLLSDRDWASGRTFINKAQLTHNSLYVNELDTNNVYNLKHIANTVNSYFIIGYDKGTIGKVEMKYDKDGKFKEASDIESGLNGDETVPVISANIGGNTPKERTFYIKEEHGELAKNADVIALVNNIIRNNSPVTSVDSIAHSSNIIHELPQKGFFNKKLKIECPVDVNVSKNGESVTSVINNNITLQKDGVYTYTVGENNDIKIVYIPTEDNYNIVLNGTDTGTMTYTLENIGDNGQVERILKFSNIALASQTRITSNTDLQNGVSLNIDDNGDGIVDRIVHPTYDSSIKNLLTISSSTGGIISTGASGNYVVGEIISLVATPNIGYGFAGWTTSNGGLFENSSSASTYFQMPANSTNLTANFELIPTTKYAFNIAAGTGGRITTVTGAVYASGDVINISAAANSGYRFVNWTSSNGGTFADANSATTTFTMPANATTVTANFEYVSTGGGSYVSSQAGISWSTVISQINNAKSGDTITVDMQGETSLPTNVLTALKGKDIIIALNISNYSLSINGKSVDDIPVEVSSYNLKVAKLTDVNLSAMVNGKDVAILELAHNGAFPFTATLKWNVGTTQSGKRIYLSYYNKSSKLLEYHCASTADSSGNVKYNFNSASTYLLTTEPFGTMKVNPGTGAFDAPNGICVSNPNTGATGFYTTVPYLIDNGKLTLLKWSAIVDNAVVYMTPKDGLYEYRNNKKIFNDINGHWAADTIDFITARELFAGVGDNRFDPNGGMTRAMFATVLSRLEDADLSKYTSSPFADVAFNIWYGAPVAWAADKGIISGYGNGLFGPNDLITREQMAVMLYNYMKYKGITLPDKGSATPFADNDKVSDWAISAVSEMKRLGLINGVGNDMYAPKDTANRASVAQIFMNFITAVVRK